ncbi:MAG: hypothetical protein WC364_10615 [Eubacteriales bacterium]|jgi:outer membrane biosynthesis protein TonB
MEITVNVNVNAPDLVAAIHDLAVFLSAKPIAPAAITEDAETKSKSEFSFKLHAQEPENKPESPPTSPPEPENKPETSEQLKQEPEEPTAPPDPPVTKEQVRAKLTALAEAGKQAGIKDLFSKFGAAKLSEVPEEKYPELLKAAEELA